MSFVSVGGDASTAPTYFEVVAAERLVPSLRAAAVYALSVSSSRSCLLSQWCPGASCR